LGKLIDDMVCQYKHIFGKPGEGAHSYRVFDVAIVDVTLTIIVAYALAILVNAPFLLVLIVLFVLGILVHRLFCVNTTINKKIFGVV
jgi:hypothetical protein